MNQNKLALKLSAIEVAINARKEDESIDWVFDRAQAIYEWLAEELPEEKQADIHYI